MSDLKSRWKSVSDKQKWAARGGSFLVKVKEYIEDPAWLLVEG